MDFTFALPPGTEAVHAGGILFGLQSIPASSSYWADFHQQPIMIGSNGQLRCSLLDPTARVDLLEDMELGTNRWYHLVLAYSEEDSVEKVFLDGRLVSARTGSFHHEWGYLINGQVGTGCVTSGGPQPEPGFIGWYGSHGVLDDFRIWLRGFSDEEVARLAQGANFEDDALLNSSLRELPASTRSNTTVVRCTRPGERLLELL